MSSSRESAAYSTIDETQIMSIREDANTYSYATERGLAMLLGQEGDRECKAGTAERNVSNCSYVNIPKDVPDTNRPLPTQNKFDTIAQLLQRNRMYENANIFNLPESAGYTHIDPNNMSSDGAYTGLLTQPKSSSSEKHSPEYENRAMWIHSNDSCDSNSESSQEQHYI